jgi:hypothetical protein
LKLFDRFYRVELVLAFNLVLVELIKKAVIVKILFLIHGVKQKARVGE